MQIFANLGCILLTYCTYTCMECSEHVTSFIDVYYTHSYEYSFIASLENSIETTVVSVDTVINESTQKHSFFKHGFYYAEIIMQIVSSVEKQFHDLRASLVFQAPCFNLGCFALAFGVKWRYFLWRRSSSRDAGSF